MKKYSILIVEDDKAIRSLIQTALEAEQFGVITAYNGASAIVQARTQTPSIILLDLGLPDTDGIQVIDEIRKSSTVPIIVVSARSEDTDKIEALNHGADDYVSKPFNVEELMARIRTSLRRMEFQNGMDQSAKQFKNGGLVIDYDSMEVRVNGEIVHLTPIEYKILAMLAQYMGKVLTHDMIVRAIWGSARAGMDEVTNLRVFMTSLRKKMCANSKGEKYIQTHIGVGYRMIQIPNEEFSSGD